FPATRHLVAATGEPERKPPGYRPPPPLGDDDPLRELFFVGGKPIAERDLVKRPALAQTLETFAKQGAAGFYFGDVAKSIVAAVAARGGTLTLSDLGAYRPTWRDP